MDQKKPTHQAISTVLRTGYYYHLLVAVFVAGLLNACNGPSENDAGSKGKDVSHDDSAAIRSMGSEVFSSVCASCHNNPVNPKTPGITSLAAMEPRVVLNALNYGKMKVQAGKLTEKQREAVAQFITNKSMKTTLLPDEAFTQFSFNGRSDTLAEYSGWGGNLAGTGFRSAAQAGITPENVSSLQLKWSFAFPGASEVRSKPAVAGEWLIVGSQSGDVFALNRQTGKIGWRVTAASAIRSGIVLARDGDSLMAYFADVSTYVYAVNVKTGKISWSVKAGSDAMSMNTGTVAVSDGKVFVPLSSIEVAVAADSSYNCCTSSGGVAALDARTGNPVWYYRVIDDTASKRNPKKNGRPFYGPSGAPVWCSPTIDTKRKLLYIGTGENYSEPTTLTSDAIQAIDMNTGKRVWNFQATEHDAWNLACPVIVNCPGKNGRDFDFGMAPILVTGNDGVERLLAGQKSGLVYALSPQNGNLLWKKRVGKGGMLGGIHWGMAADEKNLYAANADNLYGLNQEDTTIHPAPGIHALDIISGTSAWVSPAPKVAGKESYLGANSAAPAVVPGVLFAGSNDGYIRAYKTTDGQVIWSFNTIQQYKSANGLSGSGGSIDGPAPVVVDGMLFVNSGYAQFGEKPGNMLLAFEVKK